MQNRDTRLSLSEPENDIITDAQSFRPLGSGGGGGGFFFACEDFGRIYEIHSPPAFFFFFFLLAEISSRTLIALFRPGSVHSGSAS